MIVSLETSMVAKFFAECGHAVTCAISFVSVKVLGPGILELMIPDLDRVNSILCYHNMVYECPLH